MHRAAIVPEHEVADAPPVSPCMRLARGPGPELVEQRVGISERPPFDVRIAPSAEIEARPPCFGMDVHERVKCARRGARIVGRRDALARVAAAVVGAVVFHADAFHATLQPVGPEMNSKLQKKLGEDSKHAARMAAKLSLPDGITIQQAAAGFKNFGQFNAAVNLSNRLGIPFNDVKAAMTGWTLPNVYSGDATKTTIGTMSLGQTQQAYKAGTLPTYPSPETAPTAAGTSVPTISGNGV